MEWFFDGIGTELVKSIVGLIIGICAGGVVGYKIGISKNIINQKQKAGDNSQQIQVNEININNVMGMLKGTIREFRL